MPASTFPQIEEPEPKWENASGRALKRRRKARAKDRSAAEARRQSNAAEGRKIDGMRRVLENRRQAATGSPVRAKRREEQNALKDRRKALIKLAREERHGLDADVTVTEQCDRHSFTITERSEPGRRLVRRSVVLDPRFCAPAHHVDAAIRLERLQGLAAKLGSQRNPLAAYAETGGVWTPSDPEAAAEQRTRIVEADKAVTACMRTISNAPAVKTPAGWVSARDAIRICVLDAQPLTVLAASASGSARSKARALLIEALDSLAEWFGIEPSQERRDMPRFSA